MKLKIIKIFGFKSFVDPTIIQLPGNLTGVVGPNGCGKSNVIDAVRWVMGEISAKQLRGESMIDVIFNGSVNRKPVGQATVELVFDNSDAGFGGEYARYNEISIRRVINRDGFSDYFLNNASCRRKDITNIFLGSGLGPNSYAIIEQGMISKIIEAKPDELRIMIEEAAGISKYKEHRRETENRIRHTRENLSRLNDIRQELEKQLKHLKSQASAAERYRKLKHEERLTKGQLYALHWQELTKKLEIQENLIKAEEIQLEDKVAEILAFEAKISQLCEQRSIDTENFNEIQKNYYRIGSNIERLEQQIHYSKERREQLANDLNQINQVWEETTRHQEVDKNQIDLLLSEKSKLEVEIVRIQSIHKELQHELQQVEKQMQLWQEAWDSFNANVVQISKYLEVEKARIQYLEQKIYQETKNVSKFKEELASLDFANLTVEIDVLNDKLAILKVNHEKLHNNLLAKQRQITEQREINNQNFIELNRIRSKLQMLIGRRTSLEILQQTALGKDDKLFVNWLKQHSLDKKSCLAQELKVVPGWETAVETVLGAYLEAICVDDINGIISTINTLTKGDLVLFDFTSSQIQPQLNPNISLAATLLSKVESNLAISNLLCGIYIVENIAEALECRSYLSYGESVITKDGVWFGNGWLRVARGDKQKTGILQRERELQELNLIITQEDNNLVVQEENIAYQQNILVVLEREYHELQQQLQLITKDYSEAQSKVSATQTLMIHLREREKRLNQEIKTYEQDIQEGNEQLTIKQKACEEFDKQKIIADTTRQILVQKREQIQQQLVVVCEDANKKQQNVNDATMRLQLLQKQVDYLIQSLDRANSRLLGLKEHRANIEKSLGEIELPLAGFIQELQNELTQRLAMEAKLTDTKLRLANTEHELNGLERKYVELRETNEKIRTSLEKLRTERQGLQVRSNTYQEQISELELKLDNLIADLIKKTSESSTINELEEKLVSLPSQIERLGLINLAAIAEFEKLQERKNYLDAQNQDLISALNTLETVIHKIDHDSKERFKDAYENINQKFQDLFPKIFNGGKAYLAQTSEDFLETGLLIMAQPPGKRNSSIYLLSGGEKALTAISLIFSIFQLKPAPFCMLDEVDAPLDDVNVSRFCNLVKEMGKTVQFIFVTHNKLTMEIAEQLIGITMQEAGVSRIVTVDIDTAVALADADRK